MDHTNFWQRAQADPGRVVVIQPGASDVTADALLASANRVVHLLRGLGLRRGDGIAAMLLNSVEAYELVLATQQAGYYLTPVNFHLTGPEIAYILQDCEAKAFFAHGRFGETSSAALAQVDTQLLAAFAVGGDIPGFQSYEDSKAYQSASVPDDRTLGLVMNYTSGTTGRPKGVRRPLPTASVDEMEPSGITQWVGVDDSVLSPDNVHLLTCPWYHTAPLLNSMLSLHLGHRLVIMDRFDPERCLSLIQLHRVTVSHFVPTMFVRLLNLPEHVRQKYDVSSLRAVKHGAAPCSPDIKRRMIDWWGPVLYEYYASTEGVGGTLISSHEWLQKPGSVGKPRGTVVVMDDDGHILPAGQVGTIYSMPPAGAAFEYFKDPEKTAQAHRGKYSTVGDVGYLDQDGYLFLCDRKTDMIISGGVNIYPAEVEGVLIAHPKVLDVAVFGIPNEEWGEEVKAVVQPSQDVEPSDALREQLLAYASERLARYKLPRSIEFASELPRDESGKLYKRKLRDRYWATHARRI